MFYMFYMKLYFQFSVKTHFLISFLFYMKLNFTLFSDEH